MGKSISCDREIKISNKKIMNISSTVACGITLRLDKLVKLITWVEERRFFATWVEESISDLNILIFRLGPLNFLVAGWIAMTKHNFPVK
jgi:hypothetical protein